MKAHDRNSILFLGSYPPPFGGISSHLHGLLPFLRSAGFDADVVSPGGKNISETIDGIQVRRIAKQAKDHWRYLARSVASLLGHAALLRMADAELLKCQIILGVAEKIIKERNGRVDLISAYHLIPWALAGALLSRKYGIPLAVTNFGEIYSEPAYYAKRKRQVSFIVEQARLFMASSEHCARSYGRIGLEPEVRVVPYGIDLRSYREDSDGAESKDKIGLPRESTVVLFFGRLIRDMGLHTFMEAVRLLIGENGNAVYVMAGAKGDLLPEALELQTRHPDRVKVHPDVPFALLPHFYQAADMVVAPSSDDRACMGLSIKEAMAAAKPVIATRVGGIPEAVIDGRTGRLVRAEDPSELAQAIRELVKDSECRKAMGREAKNRCAELFDIEATHRKIRDLFVELMGE